MNKEELVKEVSKKSNEIWCGVIFTLEIGTR